MRAARTMPPLEPDDEWLVRYKVGELYLIHSEGYQERVCRAYAKLSGSGFGLSSAERCSYSPFFLHVWITPAGEVAGGWRPMKNTAGILLADDRKEVMFADRRFDGDWGPQPLFTSK